MENKTHNIVVCVTGGIAAYKAPEVVRLLQKQDCDVRVVMTKDAEEFIGKKTFEALSGYPVLDDLFNDETDSIRHTTLAKWADATVVVPATANILAKAAYGIADDAMTSYLLATYTPRVFAPAMNTHMLDNPATQNNLRILEGYGDTLVMPVRGLLACGDVGKGHLAEVDAIVQKTLNLLKPVPQDLKGRHVLITAGPTREYFDPIRYISNPSTGKMGLALAECARRRGAEVTVILGPVDTTQVNPAIHIVPVISACDMFEAAQKNYEDADIIICTAAVADFRPEVVSDQKIKKTEGESVKDIRFVENPDILGSLCAMNKQNGMHKCIVGFAAETNDVLKHAQQKLERKGCSLLIVNDISNPHSTFGSETNKVSLLTAAGIEDVPLMSKKDLAGVILTRAESILENE